MKTFKVATKFSVIKTGTSVSACTLDMTHLWNSCSSLMWRSRAPVKLSYMRTKTIGLSFNYKNRLACLSLWIFHISTPSMVAKHHPSLLVPSLDVSYNWFDFNERTEMQSVENFYFFLKCWTFWHKNFLAVHDSRWQQDGRCPNSSYFQVVPDRFIMFTRMCSFPPQVITYFMAWYGGWR